MAETAAVFPLCTPTPELYVYVSVPRHQQYNLVWERNVSKKPSTKFVFICNIFLKISILRFLLTQQEWNHFAPALGTATGWDALAAGFSRPHLGRGQPVVGTGPVHTVPPRLLQGTPLGTESCVNLLRETVREKIKVVAF